MEWVGDSQDVGHQKKYTMEIKNKKWRVIVESQEDP